MERQAVHHLRFQGLASDADVQVGGGSRTMALSAAFVVDLKHIVMRQALSLGPNVQAATDLSGLVESGRTTLLHEYVEPSSSKGMFFFVCGVCVPFRKKESRDHNTPLS